MLRALSVFLASLGCAVALFAQAPRRAAAPSPASPVVRGLDLAARGHCNQALRLLQPNLARIQDQQLRFDAALASAQCGMSVDQEPAVAAALLLLNRDFPANPKVMYVTTRFYSELANRSAQRLLRDAPQSAEAQQLIAEELQARGKFDEAADAFRKILKQYPNQKGMHYQLGRIILAKPLTPESARAAQAEFEAELKIDPASPATEFLLGELAQRDNDIPAATRHFRRAIEDDAGFTEAYLGLGMELNAAGHYAEAIPVLKRYVATAGDDPAGHYQLFLAYGRTGGKQQANEQLALARSTQALRRQQGPATAQDMMQPH